MKSNNVQTATKTIGALAVLGSLAYAFAQSNKKIKVATAEKESTLELDDDFDELEPTDEELEEIEKELFYLLDDVETVIEDIDLDEELDEEI
jgi:uncharacterized membrane protein YebE (DUF533 family)